MKKLLPIVLCSMLFASGLRAQQCANTPPNLITPGTGTIAGFWPRYDSLPCITVGQTVSDTIYFTNITSFGGNAISSLTIDSIENLPAGLCWISNKANNTFAGGENGVIYISGTTNAAAGQYKLRIIVTESGSLITLPQMNADTIPLKYYLRVSCGTSPCRAIDTTQGNVAFIPDTTCSINPAGITASGPTTFCAGGSVTLSAGSATGGTTVQWSTGDTTSSITVSTSGTYTVALSVNGSITATYSTAVTVITAPTAAYTLLPDTTTPHVWYILNQCSGSGLIYHWTWGDGSTTDSVANPSHTYSTAGYYDVCVSVTSDSGCTASYCDSSLYLYKTASQMIQVNVVQNPLGISMTEGETNEIKYYGGALHFATAITSPTDISLYDLSGRVVMVYEKFAGKVLDLHPAQIADGVYIVRLQNGNNTLSKKLTIVQ